MLTALPSPQTKSAESWPDSDRLVAQQVGSYLGCTVVTSVNAKKAA
jgi:hypothetical protein